MDTGTLALDGQAAFVTGGGGGIGRAIAVCLAAHGADVAVIDIIPERCEDVAAEVRALGRRALGIPGNVMEAEQVRAAVDAAAREFGRLDILVNNAGGVTRRKFTDLAEKNWRRHIDLNLISNLAATSEAVPHIIAGGRGGSIINVTSIEGSRAAPGYAVYAACKAGINNLTRTLAVELSDHGIRVNAIAPDYTRTHGTSGQFTGAAGAELPPMSAQQAEIIRKRIPLQRPGIDAECGHLAVFLASRMASYITGTIIPIDGGTWGSGGWVRDRTGDWVLPPEA
ncbi:MAG: SDR family oxidoreductase [Sphingomonadales bacterium]|nr:SDR family oxidoreductase [Sphingomonadales bacterium]